MSDVKRHAVIAGAGIGGLCAALALARAGLRVSLIERASQFEAAGAGIQLAPNAMRALDALGVGEAVRAKADKSAGLVVREARRGRVLMQPSAAAMEARWGTPSLVIHRADLQRLLLEAAALDADIALTAGAAVVGYSAGADAVAVALKRGMLRQQTEGDLLIGADGLHSAVRAKLWDGADAPRFSGNFAWRALIETSRVPDELRDGHTTLWLGPKLHLVTYPLRAGQWLNVVAVLQGAVNAAPAPDEWNAPGDPAVIAAALRAAAAPARALIAAAEDWRVWPLFDGADLPRWTHGRVTLLGDAAHPMLPFLAQGAAQAIEDAAALGAALKANGDTTAALLAYERARRGRAAEVTRQSRRQGAIYHMSGLAAAARNFVMRHAGEARLLKRLDWLYAAAE